MAKDHCACEINFAQHGKTPSVAELANSGDGYAMDMSCRRAGKFSE
ncbi:MAG TPA: hypothetical protein VNN22_05270 [Verrucomicrobiae bacterium]|nr:hypothetical protein [Verrucomicrobiae bacterium]